MLESVVAGHSPVTRFLPGAHAPDGLDRRAAGQAVPVLLDVRFELVGGLPGRELTMNRDPLSSKASRFATDSIPALATTTMACARRRSRNRGQDRDQCLGLGLAAFEQVRF